MGCCLSKKTCSSSPSGGSCLPGPNNSAINKSLNPETEAQDKLGIEESKTSNEVELQEENGKTRKEVFMIKHRRSHERSKTTDAEDSPVSDEKSTGSSQNLVDVDAILIQCGRLSRSNSAAAKTRRYSGSKRSFDSDQNERSRDAEGGGEEEAERRSREREDSKSYRSGSRERGSGSRRVSRSPGRRSETNPHPNRPAKFLSVPATDKASLVMEKSNNGEQSIKRISVKRNVGKAVSPRSQSPARAASSCTQPSPSKFSRKTELSPYRRNPLGEIDPNSVAFLQPQGDKLGSVNTNCNKRMMNRENESQGLIKESGNLVGQV